ncbi:hypothetical protein MRX96_036454 [Rhipicephalus microplus]
MRPGRKWSASSLNGGPPPAAAGPFSCRPTALSVPVGSRDGRNASASSKGCCQDGKAEASRVVRTSRREKDDTREGDGCRKCTDRCPDGKDCVTLAPPKPMSCGSRFSQGMRVRRLVSYG